MKNRKIKDALKAMCTQALDLRLSTVRSQVLEIQQALTSETKSSAGDKHETGRAMMQLEREKLGKQLSEIEKQQEVLSKVPLKINPELIGLGTIVITNSANYFIAVSVGELTFENVAYYAISPQTPIGKLLLGKSANETFSFNGRTFEIQTIT
ncbi:3-oxoacyl-ACP synthase [Bizionia sp. KMM 8389]